MNIYTRITYRITKMGLNLNGSQGGCDLGTKHTEIVIVK